VISQKFVGGKQHVPSVVKILLVKELRDVGLCRLMNDGGLDIDLLKEDKAGETVKHVVEVATKAPINAEPNFIDFNLSFSSYRKFHFGKQSAPLPSLQSEFVQLISRLCDCLNVGNKKFGSPVPA